MKETLETPRLILRAATAGDFEAVHSWAGNPENTRYMAWGPNTEEETREYLTRTTPGADFLVVLKDSMRVIGSGGYPGSVLTDPDKPGEVGWILHKDFWKQGYGTEFGGELIRYGFEDLKLRRIFAFCAEVNRGSWRVMERNGMRREALLRKAFWARVDREWIDRAEYGILAEDYFAPPSPLVGKTAEAATVVNETNTARAVCSGALDVFSTPMMTALMEQAACGCLDGTSVGVSMHVEHTAASPLGTPVTARAKVTHVSGRRITFEVFAFDGAGEIGRGEHTRVLVDAGRFMEKANGRK